MNIKGYYLIDLERSIQSGVLFYWKPHKRGYTYDITEAGVYSEQESKEVVDSDINKTTIKVSKETVNSLLKKHQGVLK